MSVELWLPRIKQVARPINPEERRALLADVRSWPSDIDRRRDISLGGGGQRFTLETEADKQRFIKSVEAICSEFGFDGIDIDFETPSLELNPGDTDPKHPTTASTVNLIAAMREIGIDISRHRRRSFDDLEDDSFDLIISLSPEAQHRAVEMTRHMACEVEFWNTFDPSVVEGSREVRLDAYREVAGGT